MHFHFSLMLAICGVVFLCSSSYASPRSIEFSKLVNMYLLPATADAGTAQNWLVGVNPSSPIKWRTSGLATDCYDQEELFCRFGNVVITINGRVTHKIFEKTSFQPVKWQVALGGSRSGISKVTIDSNVVSHNGYDLLSALEAANMKLTHMRCFREPADGGTRLFRLDAPNKRSAWLKYVGSCGTGGCGYSVEILHFVEDARKVSCMFED